MANDIIGKVMSSVQVQDSSLDMSGEYRHPLERVFSTDNAFKSLLNTLAEQPYKFNTETQQLYSVSPFNLAQIALGRMQHKLGICTVLRTVDEIHEMGGDIKPEYRKKHIDLSRIGADGQPHTIPHYNDEAIMRMEGAGGENYQEKRNLKIAKHFNLEIQQDRDDLERVIANIDLDAFSPAAQYVFFRRYGLDKNFSIDVVRPENLTVDQIKEWVGNVSQEVATVCHVVDNNLYQLYQERKQTNDIDAGDQIGFGDMPNPSEQNAVVADIAKNAAVSNPVDDMSAPTTGLPF